MSELLTAVVIIGVIELGMWIWSRFPKRAAYLAVLHAVQVHDYSNVRADRRIKEWTWFDCVGLRVQVTSPMQIYFHPPKADADDWLDHSTMYLPAVRLWWALKRTGISQARPHPLIAAIREHERTAQDAATPPQ